MFRIMKNSSFVALAITFCFTLSERTAAQTVLGQPSPTVVGQWAGPYAYNSVMKEPPMYPHTAEVAHLVVIPPPDGSQIARVVFWNRINSQCDPGSCEQIMPLGHYGRAFCLQVRGGVMTKVPVVDLFNAQYDENTGAQSLFCGGQTLLSDGSLLLVGGTDRVGQCTIQCDTSLTACGYGHKLILRMNTNAHPPFFEQVETAELGARHWYPSVISLEDGNALVAGHECTPTASEVWRHLLEYDQTATPFIVDPPTATVNRRVPFNCNISSPEQVVLTDYPRMHLLRSGDVIDTLSESGGLPMTRFFDRTLPEHCPGLSLDNWIDAENPSGQLRFGGNSVHLITLDELQVDFSEVIYAIGGGTEHDESNCNATFQTTATVERLVDPEPGVAWQAASPLHTDRMNHNTVILLDGSLAVFGGESSGDPCTPVVMAERYKTPEVFGSGSVWKELVPQATPRAYHSVAGLLPDGRVLIAGGVDDGLTGGGTPTNSYFSIEYYSPPYMFFSRPTILTPTGSTIETTYGESIDLTVNLVGMAPDDEIDRVALLRPSASTHAWDSNQRFVEVRFTEDTSTPHSNRMLTAVIPQDNSADQGKNSLPPGHYMLTVVDKNDRPSSAVWVHIED